MCESSIAHYGLQDLVGVPYPRGQVIYEYVYNIARAVPYIHWPTIVTAIVALSLLSLLPRYKWTAKVPAPLQVESDSGRCLVLAS